MSSDAESDTESIKVEPAPKLKGKGKGNQGKTSRSKGDGAPVIPVKKEHKRGVIYLSCIPPKMNVTHVRDFFSQYGEIDRSFLQPEKNSRKGKKNRTFTEGWIEFKRRRHAREVAQLLNNTPLGGKKKKQTYDFLWNIKYLVGLQWIHINERLAYERISRQQIMRAEISAAKRETAFFAKSVGLNKILKKGKKLKLKTNQPTATETAVDESLEGDNETSLQQELPASKSKKSKPDPNNSDPETEMTTPRKKKKKDQPSTSNFKKFKPNPNERNSESETETTTPRKKKKQEQPSTSNSKKFKPNPNDRNSESETETKTPRKNKEQQPLTSKSKKVKPNPNHNNSDSEIGTTSPKMKKQISKSRMQLFKSFFPSHVNAD